MNISRRVKPHIFVPYPKGNIYHVRKFCVRCGLHEDHPVHDTEKEK